MQRERGYSYAVALFAVAILTTLSLRAVENAKTAEWREREAELLYVGQAYRNAIQQYYVQTPGTVKRYPPDLKALLLDERATTTRRPLRRLYRDPITGTPDWGLVPAPDGGVMGVYSLSTRAPIKVADFPEVLVSFTGAKRYVDWQFVYQPS
ncbi:type II secretion system protein [Chitinimonas sp. BJYL2]|uniref:type II secretion system protein n=1 Tax=Chitinimonas sp. BJYL2 TaxID=2976696 RepID=UPI0022B58456|nr:type II secretion system protein [Chitinimonas sp. BJYL2]